MQLQALYKALLCWSLITMPVFAASETLQDAIQAAGESAPRLQLIASLNREADASYNASKSRLLPRVELQSNLGRFYADTPSARQHGQGGSSVNALRTELSLRQALPVFSTAVEQRNAAEHHQNATAAQGNYLKQQWMLNVIDSYLALAEARKLQALAIKNETQHVKANAIVENRVEAGRANEAHLAQSRARLALARSVVRERDSELLSAIAHYQEMTGSVGESVVTPDAGTITVPGSLDDALAMAMQRHPLLQESRAALRREQANIAAAKNSYYPEVDFEISAAYSSDSPRQSFIDGGGRETDYFIGLRLHWTLYNGGELRAKNSAASAGKARVQAESSQRKIDIRTAVQRSYQRLQGLINAGIALEEYVRNTQAASDKTLQRYRVDRSSVAEVLDSQVEYFQAQVTLVRNIHNQLRQRFQLLFDCGVLDTFETERS